MENVMAEFIYFIQSQKSENNFNNENYKYGFFILSGEFIQIIQRDYASKILIFDNCKIQPQPINSVDLLLSLNSGFESDPNFLKWFDFKNNLQNDPQNELNKNVITKDDGVKDQLCVLMFKS